MTTLNLTDSPRPLGQSTISAFPIAYGCWRFAGTDVATARAKIETALEVGIDLFDQADVYGCDGGGEFGDSEALLGRVLHEAPSLRDQMKIATKGGIVLGVPYDSSPPALRSACEDSLKRLRIESIDLYQIHRPDFLAHPAATAKVLGELREEGKIREVGVSNYSPAQLSALQAHLPFDLVTQQPEFSCWEISALRDGVLDQCMERGLTPLAWSPLAGGRLFLSHDEVMTQERGPQLAVLIETLDGLAAEQEKSREAVALSWLLAHPAGVIPIIGTQDPARIRASLQALEVQWTRSRWNQVLEASQGVALP